MGTVKRYDWGKISEREWVSIHLELMQELDEKFEWIFLASADELVEFMRIRFMRVRSKFLRPTWIRQKSYPFFNKELRAHKKNVNYFRRKIQLSCLASYSLTDRHY